MPKITPLPDPMRFDLKERILPDADSTRERWAREIGLLMVAFGSIEYLTYEALTVLPRDPLSEALRKLALHDRIEVLLAVIGGRAEAKGDPTFGRFAELLREVQKLANQRNLVAHNGVGIDVYVVNDGGLVAEESIRSGRNREKHVKFERIVEHRMRAEELEAELYKVWPFVRPFGFIEKRSG